MHAQENSKQSTAFRKCQPNPLALAAFFFFYPLTVASTPYACERVVKVKEAGGDAIILSEL